MNLEQIRRHCLSKKGKITEGFPFGEDVLVFRVNGKIFLLARFERHPLSINLKCDPEKAIELREQYEAIRPGYHMNKKYWNTVLIDGTIPPRQIFAMIDHSYEQTVKGMSKTVRAKLFA